MAQYEAVIYKGFNKLNPDIWDSFVDQSPQGTIFCKSWWLKAVCPNQIEILVLYKGERIVAGMPMAHKNKYGYNKIYMPCFTTMLGVLFEPSTSEKYTTNLTKEISILKELINAIPSADSFELNFHYDFKNWLPFLWEGYSQTTYYSYIISNLHDTKTIWKNFSRTSRNEIRKALESGIIAEESEDIEECIRLHKLIYNRQSLKPHYSDDSIRFLNKICSEHNARKIILSRNPQGKSHAMCFVIYDNQSVYGVLAGADPSLRNRGSQYLVCWKAIQSLSSLSKRFDFAGGTMYPNIELSFRNFGGTLTPYYAITKNNMSLPKKILISSYRTVRNTWNRIIPNP